MDNHNCEECEVWENCPIKDLKKRANEEGYSAEIIKEADKLLKKTIRDMVESAGYRVLKDTEYCNQFRSVHSNCEGCESEDGCRKMAKALSVAALGLTRRMPPQITSLMVHRAIEEG